MFKPVKDDELNNFDDETRELYTRRHHDPRISYQLAVAIRRNRHNLPIVVDQENPYIQRMQRERDTFNVKYLCALTFFGFSMN